MFHVKQNGQSQFVVDLLETLKKERYRPGAWGRFLWDSRKQAIQMAQGNPQLQRSWLRFTMLIMGLALLILLAVFLSEGRDAALRMLPIFGLCVLYQQRDLFWHLGLNRDPQTGKLFQRIGIANSLTWLRALGASFLLGRIFSGLNTSIPLASGIYLFGIATDILDGQSARILRSRSRLGQLGDGETDFMLSLTTTIILLQHQILSLWVGILMVLRFLLPLIAALISYFLLTKVLTFGSTLVGKIAGFVQVLYLLSLLIPIIWLQTPLLGLTILLLVLAPLAQLGRHINNT